MGWLIDFFNTRDEKSPEHLFDLALSSSRQMMMNEISRK